MIGNVGGSAGDGGFQFQAKIIAFVAVHILAETALAGLEESLEKNPLAVAAETSGPGDDIRIEFAHYINDVELQAKKGLYVDKRFDEAISKIASGLTHNTTSKVILAVNPRTGDRIKNKLSHDLDLLRQKREDALRDPNLFNRVFNIFTHFAKDEVQARELLKRLFIHTFDVEENCSRDTQTALNLLRFRVLAEEEQAAAVWSVLVQAGHTLIESRGRFDSFDFVRLLQNHNIRLSELLLPVATDRYRVWLSEKSSTFRLLGPHLGLSLPIDTAWTNLHVLSKQSEATQYDVEAQLARYHEWEQLASRDDEYYKSLDTAEIDYRVIIVGSPGSGKSTLCRKLAHDLTTFEETVMWVHLPSVVNRIQNGMNIHAALIDTAIDGFDAPLTVREALFAQADCLIADGLDECGMFVVKIAEALHNWANAHNTTRIIITTRSVGQETTFFENWSHYDLLPLTKAQVKCSAQQIITALVHDSMIASERVEQFHKQLEGNHIASLAARSPLLLGFLIQLSIEDVSLAQQRANLYEQVLNLWSTSLPQGRDWQIIQPDEAVVWRFFELFGWFLFSPRKEQLTHQQLMWKVSQELAREMDIQSLQASTVASRCLLFWHERGVLDRL